MAINNLNPVEELAELPRNVVLLYGLSNVTVAGQKSGLCINRQLFKMNAVRIRSVAEIMWKYYDNSSNLLASFDVLELVGAVSRGIVRMSAPVFKMNTRRVVMIDFI